MNGYANALAWLAHRTGKAKLDVHPLYVVKYNAADNEGWRDFQAAFGRSTFEALVGFVDLVGFSAKASGASPEAIHEYLRPFLTGTFELVSENHGLVDKMIGDEVMFFIPNYVEGGGPSAGILGGRFLAYLAGLQRKLGPEYRMRVGLAYGRVNCMEFSGKGYSEWSTVGETVHLAKRLHSLPLLKEPKTVACALGVLDGEGGRPDRLVSLAQYLVNMQYRIEEVPASAIHELKGISAAKAVYLLPKELTG